MVQFSKGCDNLDKYTYVCNESIYIVLRCFIENTHVSIKDLHPLLTKRSDSETRKHYE